MMARSLQTHLLRATSTIVEAATPVMRLPPNASLL
jgi:hypothetical protein